MKGYPQAPTTLGQHLRKRRLELNLSQAQTARHFGVSPTAYIWWEADQITPKIGKWPEIVRFLGYDPSPIPESFGETVTAARRSLGMDKRQLAAKLGVDVKSVLNWETGRTTPFPRMRQTILALAPRPHSTSTDFDPVCGS